MIDRKKLELFSILYSRICHSPKLSNHIFDLSVLYSIFFSVFRLLKIKVKSGDEAAICLKLTANTDLIGQMGYINMLNNNKTKVYDFEIRKI